jgi:RHS repeat-associated protein
MPSTFRSIKTHNDTDQLVSEWVQKGTNDSYTISYSYNDNGGLKTVSQASQPALSYTYDYNNRLKNADDASSFVEYLCDASGARIGRIHNSITNYFVIDYADGLKRPLAETDASGTISRYYVWSGMRLLCHIEADGTTRYYHSDELGSTLALTDETGSLAAEFAYMPYGHATANYLTPNTSNLTPFLWLGGYGVYYDSDTDLHLTLHRAYSSKQKRFISPDPLGIDGGANVYMWANMNPLFFVDPYGLSPDRAGYEPGKVYWEFHPENLVKPFSDWHYSRNGENDQNLQMFSGRDNITMAEIQAVVPVYIPQGEAIYHRQGLENHYNQKYTSETTGSYGRYELIVRPNPGGETYTFVNDPINMGTLNRGESKVGHVFLDVIPYYFFGNTADDPTSIWDRLTVPKLMEQQELSVKPTKQGEWNAPPKKDFK